MDDDPFIRQIVSPVGRTQLRPLDPRCQVVQFHSPLGEREFVAVADLLRGYPDVPLRIYGHYRGAPDLAFLRHFPFLKGFQADVFEIQSWDGLEFLPDSLEFLGLGATRRRFSLRQLARFTRLRDLFLDGHSKDIDVLRDLTELVYLTLRSITLPDLALLQPLRKLRSLGLKLGGTHQLDKLPGLSTLRYLELWRIRGLTDLSVVAEMPELRYLFLQDLKHVTTLPSLARLQELRRVHIENLQSLSDLGPIAAAPALEELVIVSMRRLAVDSFQCLRGHPTLRAVSLGLCSDRRNAAAAALLGLPTVSSSKPIREYVES